VLRVEGVGLGRDARFTGNPKGRGICIPIETRNPVLNPRTPFGSGFRARSQADTTISHSSPIVAISLGQGSGCRVQGSGFRNQGSGFRSVHPGRNISFSAPLPSEVGTFQISKTRIWPRVPVEPFEMGTSYVSSSPARERSDETTCSLLLLLLLLYFSRA